MKTIVLYGRRTPCWMVLNYLIAKGYRVKVITDDPNVKWVASMLCCELINGFENMGKWDLFLSVHGWQIVPMKYLAERPAVNLHPLLFKFKGHDPVSRFLQTTDSKASVGAHYMTSKADEGEVICEEFFEVPFCKSHADFYNLAYIFYIKVVDVVLNKIL